MSQSNCWVWYSRCYFRLFFFLSPLIILTRRCYKNSIKNNKQSNKTDQKRKQQQQSQQRFWKIPADLWDATQSLFLFSVAFWFLENQLGPIVHAVKHFTHSVKPRIEKPDSMERCLGLLQLGEERRRVLGCYMYECYSRKTGRCVNDVCFLFLHLLISTPIAPVQTYLIKWLLLPAHFFLV